MDALYRISSLSPETQGSHEAFEVILEEVMLVLPANSASLSLLNPDTEDLEIEVGKGFLKGPRVSVAHHLVELLFFHPFFFHVPAHGQGALGGDGPLVIVGIGGLGFKFSAGVPFQFQQCAGVLVFRKCPGHDAKQQPAVLGQLRFSGFKEPLARVVKEIDQQSLGGHLHPHGFHVDDVLVLDEHLDEIFIDAPDVFQRHHRGIVKMRTLGLNEVGVFDGDDTH